MSIVAGFMGDDPQASRLVDEYLAKHQPRLAAPLSSGRPGAPPMSYSAAAVPAGTGQEVQPPLRAAAGRYDDVDAKYTVTSGKPKAAAASSSGRPAAGSGASEGTQVLADSDVPTTASKPDKALGMFKQGGRIRPTKVTARGNVLQATGADALEKKVGGLSLNTLRRSIILR